MNDIVLIIVIVIASAIVLSISFVAYRHFAKEESGNLSRLKDTLNYLESDEAGTGDFIPETGDKLSDSILNAFGRFLPAPTPEKLDLLNKAGLRHHTSYAAIMAQQIILAILGFVAGVAVVGMIFEKYLLAPVIGLILGFLLFIAVWSDIKSKGQKRSIMIDKMIPDIIDLFANACGAGVSFDQAADYILTQLPEKGNALPIKEDFLAWQGDIRFGVERGESWKRLIDRSYSKNMKYFVNLLNQSEQSGGSASESLFKMAGFFRERKKQAIEGEIASLSGKMNGMTVLFIVIPIFILLVVPIVIEMFRTFSSIGI